MFDLQRFYGAAHNGEATDAQGFIDYVKSFDLVVLWGAGNLGRAIGQLFSRLQIPVSAFWDLKAKQIVQLGGVDVVEPFSGNFDKDRTVVIPCISNGSIVGEWTSHHLVQNGYNHFISGMAIYEGLLCPIGRNAKLDPKVCLDSAMCNICACKRFLSVLRTKNGINRSADDPPRLDFNVVTFILNQKCSLKCKHCGQYMNSYLESERINFPIERIQEDIDRFFAAADTIGVVSIIGGEPFLYPDLSIIVKHILTKNNFGIINITTNGICKLTPSLLEGLKNNRVKVSFSNYTDCLSAKQKDLFYKNVRTIESEGINYSIGIPGWGIPSSLKDKKHSASIMIDMKSSCMGIKMCMSVKNGRFYPCGTAESVHSLSIADYPPDYAAIVDISSPIELRHRLLGILNMPYFKSCSHCGGDGGELLAQAGEQGTDRRYEL